MGFSREKVGRWLGRIRGVSLGGIGVQWDGPPEVARPEAQADEEPELSELDLEVLAVLARRDHELLWTDHVVEELDVTWAKAQNSLDLLEELSLVRGRALSHKQVEGDRAYELTPAGRELAVDEGLDE